MNRPPGTYHGRSGDEWQALLDVGRQFLIEQARLERLTSYTELNTVLAQRTSIRRFDFDLDGERAAMGELLGAITERERPICGHMISSIVIYLNENDAGPGFYRLAESYGELRKDATRAEKDRFWAGEVKAVHEHYRRRRGR